MPNDASSSSAALSMTVSRIYPVRQTKRVRIKASLMAAAPKKPVKKFLKSSTRTPNSDNKSTLKNNQRTQRNHKMPFDDDTLTNDKNGRFPFQIERDIVLNRMCKSDPEETSAIRQMVTNDKTYHQIHNTYPDEPWQIRYLRGERV